MAQFAKFGISFQYPDNWVLDEEDALSGNKSITVFSPDGYIFWSIAVRDKENDPERLVEGIVNALRQDYDTLETHDSTLVVGEHEMPGTDMHFYCNEMVVTARANWIKTDQCVLILYIQGEDRSLARTEDVLKAMTTSLLTGIKDLGFRWEDNSN